jgi:hypothetical protein
VAGKGEFGQEFSVCATQADSTSHCQASSQPASQPANQAGSKPGSQAASQPASQVEGPCPSLTLQAKNPGSSSNTHPGWPAVGPWQQQQQQQQGDTCSSSTHHITPQRLSVSNMQVCKRVTLCWCWSWLPDCLLQVMSCRCSALCSTLPWAPAWTHVS